jgi:hypothetical protein
MKTLKYVGASTKHILLASAISMFALGCGNTKTIAITNGADDKDKMKQETSLHQQRIECFRKTATEENALQDARVTMRIMKENAPKVRLNEYFNAIAYSDNTASANSNITKGLAMFTSSETAVLMVVSEEHGAKRYGRPTTIRAYFNHLKDLKENLDDIKNVKIDRYGKITEVELRKNY